jgi:hypothetical protein
MFGFLVKKTLVDMMDNLLAVLLMNAGFISVAAAVYGFSVAVFELLPRLFAVNTFWITFSSMLLIIIVAGVLSTLYAGAVSGVARMMADGQDASVVDFFRQLRRSWKSSLQFGLAQGLGLGLIINAALFYLPLAGDNFLFYLIFFIAFWLYLMWMTASHYFLPLFSRYGGKLTKNVRKMFILFSDNFLFTVCGLTVLWLIGFGLSFIAILLVPGLSTLLLLQNNALKLRVYKYDYLDAHPGADRRRIPWDTLLAEERERIGKRTLVGFIFPWKK